MNWKGKTYRRSLLALSLSACLLAFLSLSSLFSSNPFSYPLSSEESLEKTIYIDFDSSLEEGANPYLTYNEEQAHEVKLTPVEHGILKSSNPLPIELFKNPEAVITFAYKVGEDLLTPIFSIEGNNPLQKTSYNYVHIFTVEEGCSTEFGFYGKKEENKDATYATQRVWFHDSNLSKEKYYKLGVGYETENDFHIIIMASLVNIYDGEVYHYADIPYQQTSLHFLKIKGKEHHDYIYEADYEIPALVYGTCYFELPNASLGPLNVNGASATLLKYVVEAFLTYGKDPSNGAEKSTIQRVFSTWFMNKSAALEELKNTKIKDYTGYSSNGNSYEGLAKNSEFSVSEKWNAICFQAGIDPNTGKERTISFSFGSMRSSIIISFGVVALLGLVEGIVLLIRRKDYS